MSHKGTFCLTVNTAIFLDPYCAFRCNSFMHAFLYSCLCFRELFVFFIKQILCQEMTEQICYFLVPSICNEVPIVSFIKAVPSTSDSFSIWLLYSFLSVGESQIGMTRFLFSSRFKIIKNFFVLVKTLIIELIYSKYL